MNGFFLLILAVVVVCARAGTDYQDPPEIFQASEYTTWGEEIENSRKAQLTVDYVNPQGEADQISMIRLDLVGDSKQRGYAHGALLAHEIMEFVTVKLPIYYASMLPGDFIEGLPEPLQKLAESKVVGATTKFFESAMWWVYGQEEKYMEQELIDEMEYMAQGVCHTLGGSCNVTAMAQQIKTVNMLPELVRMACTAYGAWGEATANTKNPGGLVQVRALDFGGGPFVNYTVIATSRTSDNSIAFTDVKFPGLVGSITGVSQSGIGISEKVWMVNGNKNLQYGRYDGVPDVFALRHILEHAKTRFDAEAWLRSITRTFAIFMGIGDYTTGKFDLVGYKRQRVQVFDDESINEVTSMPVIKDVTYVDQHPQPSTDPSLPQVLSDHYGDLSMENARVVTQYHKTGDVHIAVYDYSARQMLVSIGKVNGDGNYYPEGMTDDNDYWMAYNRPYIQFSLDDLFTGK